MTTSQKAWSVLLAVAAAGAVPSSSLSADDNWGKWGPTDQIGTLNYITPEVIGHAASLVRQGKVVSLALPLAAYQPSPNRKVEHHMLETGQGSHESGRPLWMQDWLSLPCHGTTHWDGLGHVFGKGKIYNGYDAQANVTSEGTQKNGIQNARNKVVARGVLVDLVRYKNLEHLPPGYVITPEDIEGAARAEKVAFRPGDVILIRTGWINTYRTPFRRNGSPDVFSGDQPGIGWATSQWLKQQRAAAVALDNLDGEAIPCEPEAARRIGPPSFSRPIHYELIRNQGMMIGELFKLDGLAEACAKDGVYEFMFVAVPLNLTNATASPLNPQAIR